MSARKSRNTANQEQPINTTKEEIKEIAEEIKETSKEEIKENIQSIISQPKKQKIVPYEGCTICLLSDSNIMFRKAPEYNIPNTMFAGKMPVGMKFKIIKIVYSSSGHRFYLLNNNLYIQATGNYKFS